MDKFSRPSDKFFLTYSLTVNVAPDELWIIEPNTLLQTETIDMLTQNNDYMASSLNLNSFKVMDHRQNSYAIDPGFGANTENGRSIVFEHPNPDSDIAANSRLGIWYAKMKAYRHRQQ